MKPICKTVLQISAASLLFGLASTGPAHSHDDLTIVSWGGSYARSQMRAFVRPFREDSGEWAGMETYGGGLDQIRAQVAAENVTWDVVDFELSDLLAGCKEGLLEKVDHSALAPAADGASPADDFIPGALTDCGVGQNVWSTVVAYDKGKVGGEGPTKIADFFDLKKFPGPRGLRRDPRVALEWGLMADGIPAEKVYEVLGTDRGVNRAFRALDRIKSSIVWWRDGATPPKLLEKGEVVMTSVWNGRMYGPIVDDGKNFAILWDAQIWDIDSWGIVKGTERLASAMEFVRFATSAPQLAEQTKHISYGPARKSAMALVSDTVKPHLPTAEANQANAVQTDAQWWAENQKALTARFETWIGGSASALEGVAR